MSYGAGYLRTTARICPNNRPFWALKKASFFKEFFLGKASFFLAASQGRLRSNNQLSGHSGPVAYCVHKGSPALPRIGGVGLPAPDPCNRQLLGSRLPYNTQYTKRPSTGQPIGGSISLPVATTRVLGSGVPR